MQPGGNGQSYLAERLADDGTDTVLADLDGVAVLTGDGGALAPLIKPHEREWVAITGDGRVVITEEASASARRQARLRSILNQARGRTVDGVPFEPAATVVVPARALVRVYDDHIRDAQARDARAEAAAVAGESRQAALGLLREAADAGASDIHVFSRPDSGTEVEFRIHGDLHWIRRLDARDGLKLINAVFALQDSGDQSPLVTEPQNGEITDPRKLPGRLEGVRAAYSGGHCPGGVGRKMVLRLHYGDRAHKTLADQGFHPAQQAQIEALAASPTGITLFGGPTGSGKTTTLKAILDYIRDRRTHETARGRIREAHILTVEDPVEGLIEGATQISIGNSASDEARDRQYRQALRHMLRMDPDVALISEVRDGTVGNLALQAAMSGHQVWSTLHANTALAMIPRLHDLGVDLFKLTDPANINGFVSQRLAKRLCLACARPLREAAAGDRAKARLLERARSALPRFEGVGDLLVTSDQGCPACLAGTVGRTVVAEVLVPDTEILRLIHRAITGDGAMADAHAYWLDQLGGMTLAEHAVVKAMTGTIDVAAVEAWVGPIDRVPLRQERIAEWLA